MSDLDSLIGLTLSQPSPKPELQGNGSTPKQPSTPATKRPPESKSKRPNKRFKGTSRHGGPPAYDKSNPSTGLLTSPRRPFFTCFTSTLGCESFTAAIHRWCVGRDYRFGTTCTLVSMQYASLIAMLARMSIINEQVGTRIDDLTSRLKSVAKSILLPEPICKMIEALGIVRRPGMPTLVPLFPLWTEYEACELYSQPIDLLERAGREIPPGPWAIDVEYLAEYINHAARGESKSLGFRSVDLSTYEGRIEMLYGYSKPRFAEDIGDLTPCGPSSATQVEAELGAVYCFRDHDFSDLWIKANGNHLVLPDFIGVQFSVPMLTARLAGEHLKKGLGN